MFKKSIAILLALILVFSNIPAAMAAEEPTRLDPTEGLIPQNTKLTRGAFFYALWRFCGSPEPTIENPFTDLSKNHFCYKAVLWAIENQICVGMTSDTFELNQPVFRAQVATFLYRALAEEDVEIPENMFTDLEENPYVYEYYYEPAMWACNEGYMSARKETNLFGPYEQCYYGQIYWDKNAPAVDDRDWYGYIYKFPTIRPIGSNIEVFFDEETGTLTFSGTGGMAWTNDRYGFYNMIAPWDSYAEQVKAVVLEEGITRVGSLLFTDFPNLESVSIPESIIGIHPYAFYGCKAKNVITLPSCLEDIDEFAFHGFENLEGIVIPKTVTELERGAFRGCKNITEANIPDGITVIKDLTFYGCEKLSRIYIPATVTTIEMEAFDKCPSLTDVYYSGTAEQWAQIKIDYSSWGGTNLVLQTANIHCLAEEPKTGVCGEDATWVLQSNGTLTISGTGSMYDYVPSDTAAVQITAETTAAPWSAMRNRINTVEIQEGITHIGSNAFSDCKNLNAAILPDSVTSAGNSVFAGCDKLDNVYYGGTQEDLEELFGDALPGNSNIYVEMPDNPFLDVKPADYYCGSVLWAFENGITNGTDTYHFSPAVFCNRAQVVTFLWRAAGSPEPTAEEHPFVDAEKGSFYEKAVLWAVENGITTGTDETHFSPNAPCNRAAVVTFLYRAFQSPAVEGTDHPFTDVPTESWYTAPVLWAVEKGIAKGLTAASFGPDTTCNRAQVVTFLYRGYVN